MQGPSDSAAPSPPSSVSSVASPRLSSGQRVILWLFVALAAATALTLLYFAMLVEPEFRPRIYGALVGDLAIPAVAWFAFRWMNRPRTPS